MQIVNKDTIGEIIFWATEKRNRLMLELMAGEVLKLTPKDVQECYLAIQNHKDGRKFETVYVPRKILGRLSQYVQAIGVSENNRIFPISYATTYASRSGSPVEIVSMVIVRHVDLSTTQRYLGKVNNTEVINWIENTLRVGFP